MGGNWEAVVFDEAGNVAEELGRFNSLDEFVEGLETGEYGVRRSDSGDDWIQVIIP